jgi:hypothetical protein
VEIRVLPKELRIGDRLTLGPENPDSTAVDSSRHFAERHQLGEQEAVPKKKVITATVLFLLVGAAQAADEAVFEFTWAFIQSLGGYHTANVLRYEQQNKVDPKTLLTLGGYVDFMTSFESQNRLLKEAADLIGQYQNDQRLTPFGRQIAQLAALEYLEMIEINKAAASLMRAFAPDAKVSETIRAMEAYSQRLIEIQSRRGAVDVDLGKMAAGLTDVILGMEELRARTDIPKDAPMAKTARLHLTGAERHGLVARLEEIFGPTVKQYVEKDETAAPGAACLLWKFLATSGFGY